MRPPDRGSLVVVATISTVLLAACTATGTAAPSTTPAGSRPTSSQESSDASGAATQSPDTFEVTGAQATEVAHLMDFISAYNAGHLQTALSQFSSTQAVGFSDCDYATQQLVDGHGIVQVAAWLRQNIADHDRLLVAQVLNQNPDQPLGVLGVSFSKRSSNSIARAGRTNGMTPTADAKVKFDSSGLITEFNNGPYGGPPGACRLS